MKELRGRAIVSGNAEGDVVYTDTPITFYGGVDMRTGKIIQADHPLRGQSIAGKVLVMPFGVGSTVGSYVIYGMKRYGCAPAAIVLKEVDTVIATGAILAKIPTVDRVPIEELANARRVRVQGERVIILG